MSQIVWGYRILRGPPERPETVDVKFDDRPPIAWTTEFVTEHIGSIKYGPGFQIVLRADGVGFYRPDTHGDGGILWVMKVV